MALALILHPSMLLVFFEKHQITKRGLKFKVALVIIGPRLKTVANENSFWRNWSQAMFKNDQRLICIKNFKHFAGKIMQIIKSLVITSITIDSICYAKSLQSFPTLGDPIDGSPPGFPVPGILQAGTLEWAAISFSNIDSIQCPKIFYTLELSDTNLKIGHKIY